MLTPEQRESSQHRFTVVSSLRRAWATSDPGFADSLDALALTAAYDRESLDILLTVVIDFRLCHPALYQYLMAVEDIETAEQTTLVAVALRLRQYEGRARFTTWLHRIASNEAKMLIRARSRRPSDPTANLPEVGFVSSVSSLVGDRDMISAALDRLPDDLRSVLELREVEGYTYEEIADMLIVPIGTVRSRLNRARKKLLAELSFGLPLNQVRE